jgi:hypothetical protein
VTAAAPAAGVFVVLASFGMEPAVAVPIAFYDGVRAVRIGDRQTTFVAFIPRPKRTYGGRPNRPT